MASDKLNKSLETFQSAIVAAVLAVVMPLIEKQSKENAFINKPFLTLREAASYLDVSERTIYGYISQKKLSHYKPVDGKIYFSIRDLNEFIMNEDRHYKSISQAKNELNKRYKNVRREKQKEEGYIL
jgi:excisionase family DNA binding protein